MLTDRGIPGGCGATGWSVPAGADISLSPAARFGRDSADRRHTAYGSLLKTLAVAANGVDVGQRMAHGIPNRTEDGVGECPQPVIHPQSFFPGLDQPGPPEIREVPRRLRLRHFQALVDVTDADLAGYEEPEDAKPGRVRQGPEQRLHLENLFCHIYALTNIARALYSGS